MIYIYIYIYIYICIYIYIFEAVGRRCDIICYSNIQFNTKYLIARFLVGNAGTVSGSFSHSFCNERQLWNLALAMSKFDQNANFDT